MVSPECCQTTGANASARVISLGCGLWRCAMRYQIMIVPSVIRSVSVLERKAPPNGITGGKKNLMQRIAGKSGGEILARLPQGRRGTCDKPRIGIGAVARPKEREPRGDYRDQNDNDESMRAEGGLKESEGSIRHGC